MMYMITVKVHTEAAEAAAPAAAPVAALAAAPTGGFKDPYLLL